ncbi:hypothetical protein CkaCkLH20_01791 [Colletotrichum karsti]|uniref:Uncharacterized protein n=1 Tax=Colletotrichum karsti TaxID=1095194 RepID=A0A9P6IE39_9PEZI|nr:uncharacterized protein CkaCkLH20_01791 [Colletotrichum karsti]KAF9880749.1 hypothetical protein CkaCkLH20_01791 [Colletotrichum karsti]
MPEQNPMQSSASPPPQVSKSTIHMSGLLVDVYGLDELAAQNPASVSCLWLFHGRGRRKEDMGDFASRVVARHAAGNPAARGLIALAFDQRNHGTRLVSEVANESWRGGNERHAIDMYAMVAGMVGDTRGLMDVAEGILKVETGGEGEWRVEQHLALGVSLGGHSTWQALFGEERIVGGVVIIGCPDYMALMTDRAQRSKLATYSAEDDGASFLGSRDFPPDLVSACLRNDPKGILFGTGAVPSAAADVSEGERQRLRGLLDARVRGKKFLVCSGAVDRLVPYSKAEPFVNFFEEATRTWYADGGVTFENIVYEGVGHAFSEGMVEDACRFLLDAVRDGGKGEERRAKI